MTIKSVALVGASGNLGSPILDALVHAGHFDVTVIQRASSKSQPSQPVPVVRVGDQWDEAELASALRGFDACIACYPLKDVSSHLRLASAASAAGVQRFIPADFGSVDARSSRARELVKLFDSKVQVREKLEQLAAQSGGGFTWTSLVAGHFFDWGLRENFLHFDIPNHKALILGDGTDKMSNSTLAQVGRAVVKVLEKPEETADRVLLVQSFCVSSNEILESLEKATGRKWEVERRGVDEYVEERKREADKGDKGAVEDLVFALGIMEGNWEGHEDFAMELLGLEGEDLDEIVRGVVESM